MKTFVKRLTLLVGLINVSLATVAVVTAQTAAPAPTLQASTLTETPSRAVAPVIAAVREADAVAVQTAEAHKGMVVSGHPQATAAGVEVFKAGGNVIDAAIAVSLSLGVTEPYGSGLGGKLVIVYREASSGKVSVIEAFDAASNHLDVESFKKASAEERKTGALSVGVPGLPAGLMLAHEKWGKLPRAKIFAPAIKLAGEGFIVEAGQVRFFQSQLAKLKANEALAAIYMPGGAVPKAGQKIVNADLAKTLALMVEKGADGFYRGPVAEAIVKEMQSRGSPLALDDFAQYKAKLDEPLHIKFRGIDVYSSPPPASGGGIALLTLAAWDDPEKAQKKDALATAVDALKADAGEKVSAHEKADAVPTTGASLFTPADMNRFLRMYLESNYAARGTLGDRPSSRKDWEALLAPASLEKIRAQADAPQANSLAWAGNLAFDDGAQAAETTHFVVMDVEGNVASVTQSQSLHFGSGIVPAGTGVVLNDSLSNFATNTSHPNGVKPGARPASTITPTVLVREGKTLAGVGLPGGSRIPSTMVQVMLDRIAYGRSWDLVIAASRFHPSRRQTAQQGPEFQTEKETDSALGNALKAQFGWSGDVDGGTETFGGVNAVELAPDGVLHSFADQRRTNAAAGY